MTRMVPIALILLFGLALSPQSARAEGTARWCAVYSVSGGNVREDYNYRTVEACRKNIIAGDRGTCNMNPRYSGDAESKPPRRR
jgi:hypothetical protein